MSTWHGKHNFGARATRRRDRQRCTSAAQPWNSRHFVGRAHLDAIPTQYGLLSVLHPIGADDQSALQAPAAAATDADTVRLNTNTPQLYLLDVPMAPRDVAYIICRADLVSIYLWHSPATMHLAQGSTPAALRLEWLRLHSLCWARAYSSTVSAPVPRSCHSACPGYAASGSKPAPRPTTRRRGRPRGREKQPLACPCAALARSLCNRRARLERTGCCATDCVPRDLRCIAAQRRVSAARSRGIRSVARSVAPQRAAPRLEQRGRGVKGLHHGLPPHDGGLGGVEVHAALKKLLCANDVASLQLCEAPTLHAPQAVALQPICY